MKRRPLGRTGIEVSALCLGSMTWGSQNDDAEAAAQIERALERGVNFIDTAEMYPTTPLRPETQGRTESAIGAWLAASGRRDELVIATKVTGNGRDSLDGGDDITGEKIRASFEGSLRRLGTDVIDLYQLHWPNRGSYHFRQNWTFDASGQTGRHDREAVRENIRDVLETCAALIEEGKLRAVGLSNESAWGTLQFLDVAEEGGLPRVASIQNEYNLMNRLFDTDLAETAHHEDVGLLAFSPLAAGILSGKYADGARPEGSRRTLNDTLGGRWTANSERAAAAYAALAREHGLEPAQLALAFCLERPFMTSVIIGATDMAQLDTNLDAADTVLTDELRSGHRRAAPRAPRPDVMASAAQGSRRRGALVERMRRLSTRGGRAAPVRELTMGRGGTPEEVARAILWLLSAECSYTAGTFVEVTGGIV